MEILETSEYHLFFSLMVNSIQFICTLIIKVFTSHLSVNAYQEIMIIQPNGIKIV